MKTLFLALACLCLWASESMSQPVIVPDTLIITLPQGDSGESLDRQALLENPVLKAMINVANKYPGAYIRIDEWRSNVKWEIARGNKRVSRALDGGVQEWTATYFEELLAEAGLKEEAVDEIKLKTHCCKAEPTLWFRLLWKKTEAKETPAKVEKTEVNNWYTTTIQKIGGRIHLGVGGMTSPYNGALSLNLEAQLDSLSCLELAFGHSTGLLGEDRLVTDPTGSRERQTFDMVYSGRYIRYLNQSPWLGIHIGLIRVENTMEYNLKHIRLFQGLTVGPSVRWKNLSASASIAYGNEKFYGEDSHWRLKAFGDVTVYFWR